MSEQSKQESRFNPGLYSYTKDTIEWSHPEGGRDLVAYEKAFLFNRSKLTGKKVLDLGAGSDVNFAKQLKETGVKAYIVSLSPNFAQEKHGKRAKKSFPEGEIIAAVGQALPFKKESFDRIFSLHVMEHLSGEKFLKCVLEMARVLKKGGMAKIGPAPDAHDPYYEILKKDKDVLEKLGKLGVKAIIENIPKENAFIRSMKVYYGDDHIGQRVYGVTCHNIVLIKD